MTARVDVVCTRCSRPVGDQAYLCPRCAERLERALGDVAAVLQAYRRDTRQVVDRRGRVRTEKVPIPKGEFLGWPSTPWEHPAGAGDLARDAAVTYTRQARTGEGSGRRGFERPLPWDERASAAVRELHATLVGWVRLVIEERGLAAPGWPRDQSAAMAGWLLGQREWLRHHPDAATVVDDIDQAVARLRVALDRAPERWFAGLCEVVWEGPGCVGDCGHDSCRTLGACGRDLYARPDTAEVECRDCGATYDVAARREFLLAAAEDQLATAAVIARSVTALGREVSGERIRQWASRGRLLPRSVDLAGRPTYRLGDVLDLLAEDARAAERKAATRRTRAS